MLSTPVFSELVAAEALAGLTTPRKTLPAKLLYDDEGCRLFGEITRLPEYYVTRTERSLLAQVVPSIEVAPNTALVEYGASDEAKALILIKSIDISAYIPVDVAGSALKALQIRLAASSPKLAVYPIEADFMSPLTLPDLVGQFPKLGFFPGSTIGNLDPAMAQIFLAQVKQTLGEGALFLVGVDLRKDVSILVPAYDDPLGVTAAFNRNVLARLNREASGTFNLDAFTHRAIWNEGRGRIEMHLESQKAQTASVAGETIMFEAGETIHTENSYKHTLDGFAGLARASGWHPLEAWTDPKKMFSLHLLQA